MARPTPRPFCRRNPDRSCLVPWSMPTSPPLRAPSDMKHADAIRARAKLHRQLVFCGTLVLNSSLLDQGLPKGGNFSEHTETTLAGEWGAGGHLLACLGLRTKALQ